MTDVDASALPELFGRYAERFAAEKQALIELDGKVGDSDLGLTMAKGFAAADAALAEMFADCFLPKAEDGAVRVESNLSTATAAVTLFGLVSCRKDAGIKLQ